MNSILARLNLRLRLTLTAAGVALAALIAIEVLTLSVLRSQLYDTVDANLSLEVRAFQQRLSGSTDVDKLEQMAREFIATDPGAATGLAPVIRVRINGRATLTSTPNKALIHMVSGSAAPGSITTVNGSLGEHRMAAAAIAIAGKPAGDLRVALPLRDAQAVLNALTPLMTIASLLIAAGAGVAARLLVGRALAPVARITETAAGISDRDLSVRIGHRGPADEVGLLARNFDGMLARLEAGFRSRGEVYALASHELRTPLTIIRGHLQVLRQQSNPDPKEVREVLDIALEELERITEEVNDMLLLGRMLLSSATDEQVDLRKLLLDIHRRARGAAPQHWVVETPSAVVVKGNRDQLSKALLNLVVNAARHTPEQGEIRLSCAAHDGRARVVVADSGEGIALDDLPRVFEPWFRGDAGRSIGGLGLTVVQEVIRGHGGEIHVESEPGSGTRFTIDLPLA